MVNSITVVIRNKNQSKALEFLLRNLNNRYSEDISEIIVIDNESTDDSELITNTYGANFHTIKKFSYGGSANLAGELASNNIVVIFSAHAYPVSHDFFKQIKLKFKNNSNLAGVRCLHNHNDYSKYINNISAKDNPNGAGLIFCGSAFNKSVWETHQFKADITTFEDKEWTLRVLENGFDIEFCPSIFNYNIKRTKRENHFRFKNELIGSYKLWHNGITYKSIIRSFFGDVFKVIKNSFLDMYYTVKRLLFKLYVINNKPDRY
jgi:GT2 family glycosyltransferase